MYEFELDFDFGDAEGLERPLVDGSLVLTDFSWRLRLAIGSGFLSESTYKKRENDLLRTN